MEMWMQFNVMPRTNITGETLGEEFETDMNEALQS